MGAHIFMDLVRWFREHIFRSMPVPEIKVSEATQKAVIAIDNVFKYWDEGWGNIIEAMISKEAAASIDNVKELLLNIREKLAEIQTLEDIPEEMEDIVFSNDTKLDAFIKSLVKQIISMFADKVISPAEALLIISNVILYFKER